MVRRSWPQSVNHHPAQAARHAEGVEAAGAVTSSYGRAPRRGRLGAALRPFEASIRVCERTWADFVFPAVRPPPPRPSPGAAPGTRPTAPAQPAVAPWRRPPRADPPTRLALPHPPTRASALCPNPQPPTPLRPGRTTSGTQRIAQSYAPRHAAERRAGTSAAHIAKTPYAFLPASERRKRTGGSRLRRTTTLRTRTMRECTAHETQ